MSANHLAAASDAINALNYHGANLDVARHWLTCWRRGQPPRMRAYSAGEIWQHKPAMMICRVVRDKSFTCVKGGALLRVALGYDVTNKDLLSLAPEDQRAARLDWAWAITEGAITVLYRRFASKDGHEGLAQGIALPFSGEDTNGSRHLLLHTNWRPVGTDWIIGNVDVDVQNTTDRRMISFMTKSAKLSSAANL